MFWVLIKQVGHDGPVWLTWVLLFIALREPDGPVWLTRVLLFIALREPDLEMIKANILTMVHDA